MSNLKAELASSVRTHWYYIKAEEICLMRIQPSTQKQPG